MTKMMRRYMKAMSEAELRCFMRNYNNCKDNSKKQDVHYTNEN